MSVMKEEMAHCGQPDDIGDNEMCANNDEMTHCSQPEDTVVNYMSTISLKDPSDTEESIKGSMLQRICYSDAFFKHQQRGEPDLTVAEKYKIAEEILSKNKTLFLERFWKHLGTEDVLYFKRYSDEYEVDFYLKQICKFNTSNFSKNQIKNRRYKAMQHLISDGEYFSEDEMKYRDPYLYEQLVGQYLTDDEVNDRVDKTDLRFSTILINHMDILQKNELYKDQKDREDFKSSIQNHVTRLYIIQEGQMEEEEESEDEEIECELEDDDTAKETIPDAQKATLKEEFLTIMQERFMSGQDKHFNYSEVDNNTDYDDLDILQKDEEEKYFDIDDGNDSDILDNNEMDCNISNQTCMESTTELQAAINTNTNVISGNCSEVQNCTDQT